MTAIDDLKRLAGLEPYRRLLDLKLAAEGTHKAICPWHDDHDPSLVVYSDGHHHCFACQAHGDAIDLIEKLEGCETITAKRRLEEIVGVAASNGSAATPGKPREVAVYDYVDEQDALLYQVVRYEPKSFKQRRPDGRGGWIWGLGDVRRPLYRLPQVLAAQEVWICEGEKDVETLEQLGLTATTQSGGANAQWSAEHTDALIGRTAIVVPDNDQPGRKRGERILHALTGAADEALVVELPADAKDATDFVAKGNGLEAVRKLVEQARERAKEADRPPWHSWPQLDKLQADPPSFLVSPLLADGGLTMLVGRPGSYKSWLALDLSRAVATGASFAGRARSPERPVLYIDAENGPSLVASRRDFLQIPPTPNLRYWGRFSGRPFLALDAPELREFAAAERPLIIVDSFIRFHRGSENDNSEVAVTMGYLLELTRVGATVLLLHHAGKDREKLYRGAMELEAAPDLCIRSERIGDSEVRLAVFKNRFGSERSYDLRLSRFGFEWLSGSTQGADDAE